MSEFIAVLTRYDYTLFTETATALYWKSPVGSTVTLFKAGGWRHSGADSVTGLFVHELADRLLKYHHHLVPKV